MTKRTVEPYEVFRQEKDGDPMRHGGNVLAPDPELAMHYARELFGRRGESDRLWIVRRADIVVLEDADLLHPPLDRSYKKPGGYIMRDKLAAARGKAGTSKPKARATGHDRTGGRRSSAGGAS
jgi:phenylacetate-CoA oxygenase PaaH subunit